MLKTIIIMLIAVTAATVGDVLLAKGMKGLGDISAMNLRGIISIAVRALTEWKIVVGTAMMVIFFFLWLAVLSWEDISIAIPMQALNYVIVALLAKYYMHEEMSPLRWIGITMVCVGVILITKSSKTDKPPVTELAQTVQIDSRTGGI